MLRIKNMIYFETKKYCIMIPFYVDLIWKLDDDFLNLSTCTCS